MRKLLNDPGHARRIRSSSRQHDIKRVAILLHLLAVTMNAAVRDIDLMALERDTSAACWVNSDVVLRCLLRADLQLRGKNESPPRRDERCQHSQENQRAMVHRATSAGLRAAGSSHSTQQRQQLRQHSRASERTRNKIAALPITSSRMPIVLMRMNGLALPITLVKATEPSISLCC